MASLDDAITVLQNIAIALNSVTQKISDVEGSMSQEAISAATLLKKGKGRVCRVCVTTAGTTVGSIYDVQSVSLAAAGALVATIPNTVGVYEIKMPLENGLVVTPGSGQVVSVSYS